MGSLLSDTVQKAQQIESESREKFQSETSVLMGELRANIEEKDRLTL